MSLGIGMGWIFALRLLVAGALTAVLGLERELHNKDAGLRTYTLVGFGSALIMIVSQYGYDAVLRNGVVLDPSRTVAQVVSGIGFLGGGLIFVKQDVVRGLTTAAGVWASAAIGIAVGAGMIPIAAAVTGMILLITYGFGWVERRLLHSKSGVVLLDVQCRDERGVLAQVAATIAEADWNIETIKFQRDPGASGLVRVRFALKGSGDLRTLIRGLGDLESVIEATSAGSER